MKSPKHDRDITSMSERALLEVLVNQPVRITMDQMRGGPLSDLREKGFVVCGQEMVNCTAIHAHDGDVIVMGEPSLAAWIVIKPAGREWLENTRALESSEDHRDRRMFGVACKAIESKAPRIETMVIDDPAPPNVDRPLLGSFGQNTTRTAEEYPSFPNVRQPIGEDLDD